MWDPLALPRISAYIFIPLGQSAGRTDCLVHKSLLRASAARSKLSIIRTAPSRRRFRLKSGRGRRVLVSESLGGRTVGRIYARCKNKRNFPARSDIQTDVSALSAAAIDVAVAVARDEGYILHSTPPHFSSRSLDDVCSCSPSRQFATPFEKDIPRSVLRCFCRMKCGFVVVAENGFELRGFGRDTLEGGQT